ncbi:MAG: hypothetical protein F4X16_05570 [Caldilineaceae bacterium SB0661_bin_34]|nr:hypothetical protein [Caldilineaceae bacterium SB0661_bin_34]
MNIYRAAVFAAKIGVHKNTVKVWSLNGQWPDRHTPVSHRHCTDADMERVSEPGRTVVYGRVSSRAQRDDRRSQQQAMETFCLGADLAMDKGLTEIGGGLDFQRPVFRSLMERMENRELGLLPVARKDSLPVRV